MLAFDIGRPASSPQIAAQRLVWVDFLTVELIEQMGGKYDGSILSILLDIARMLDVDYRTNLTHFFISDGSAHTGRRCFRSTP
ncbi:hypothetical protein [Agrobacterium arsenijevicii]|uniref:Uncharacterized protein n=1 Tax=Agrobacterium arsenijevicii TaxID=1585697 RepID=A0ABR5CYX5_9HYPH|nr:hypothetical protein RP75_28625 [Agrobacterium arsenijevicii]